MLLTINNFSNAYMINIKEIKIEESIPICSFFSLAVTFAALEQSSAPGQTPFGEMRKIPNPDAMKINAKTTGQSRLHVAVKNHRIFNRIVKLLHVFLDDYSINCMLLDVKAENVRRFF